MRQKCYRRVSGAIDFEQKEEFLDIKVGTVVLATGFD